MTTPTHTLELTITGMHCASCALLIDDTLTDLPGVLTSTTSSKTRRGTITHNNSASQTDILNAIEQLGYHAEPTNA